MVSNPNIATVGVGGDPTPPEGQRVIGPLSYDFSVQTSYVENLRAQMENLSLMSFALAMFIDNGQNANGVTINFAGQLITVKGRTQGWYPVISQRPIQYVISCAGSAGVTSLFFSNFHIPGFQWGTVPGSGPGISQTPWTQNIDGAGFSLANVPTISGNGSLILAPGGGGLRGGFGTVEVDTNGKARLLVDHAGHVIVNAADDAVAALQIGGGGLKFPDGTVQSSAATGGSGQMQTPWAQNINAAGFSLSNVPTVRGNGALTLDSGGAAAVAIAATAGGLKFPDGSTQTTAGQAQSPWVGNINAAGFSLNNAAGVSGGGALAIAAGGAGSVTVSTSAKPRLAIDSAGHVSIAAADDAAAPLQVNGPINSIAGGFKFPDGTIQTSAAATGPGAGQTPWYQNVSAAGFSLLNAPNISSAAALTLTAAGTGALALQTNATTRLSIDSAGSATLAANDSGFALLNLKDSTGYLKYDTSAALTIRASGYLNFQAASFDAYLQAGNSIYIGSLSKNRLQIDSAGHVQVNTSDSGDACLYCVGPIRTADYLEETTGQTTNAYWNGSAWVYRRANSIALQRFPSANALTWSMAPAGTANAAISFNPLMTFSYASGIPYIAMAPSLYWWIGPSGYSPETTMPNGTFIVAYASNTQILLKFKGSDGVMRSASLTVS